jgi:1-aminocyclopropane-1-carboxylate deaminase
MLARTDTINLELLKQHGVTLHIRREDLLFPELSGNKYRKLKYNLEVARKMGHTRILTFGGAFSNHIHALAAAGKIFGFETVGFIRGDELSESPLNPTLEDAQNAGMHHIFLKRSAYALRNKPEFQEQLLSQYGPGYIVPEGGTNALAVNGCAEMLQSADSNYDYICCAVGTGGTLGGLVQAAGNHQQVIGYSALKAADLEMELQAFIPRGNWQLRQTAHFGGYARVTEDLVVFINDFKHKTGISLDPVYTGKMIFGILEDVKNQRIPSGSRVLAMHTGGLQGIRGMNQQLAKKALPLLEL